MAKAHEWVNVKRKKGYARSKGGYNVYRGDRHFVLTSLKDGKTRRYESHEAAKADGWEKAE